MEITTGFRLLSLFGELSGKEKASLLLKNTRLHYNLKLPLSYQNNSYGNSRRNREDIYVNRRDHYLSLL
jgi:hypothetical protein